ncbi:MAG: Maf family protein [Clostridiales Family XIII bacterium]|nr:Maf family protein [Clostridiales Family XIII bacterium]
MNIILASASPRRYEILKKHGVEAEIVPSGADERLPPELRNRPVREIVVYLARKKARAVYERLCANVACRASFILAADTVVYKDGIIGKPVDEADAFRILSSLRASSHLVITGVSLIKTADGKEENFFDVTEVFFKDYPDEEIYRYIREESPYDKSGSYAVQSSWSGNVDRVEGDIENVMGLPWYRLAPLLGER